MGRVSEKYTFSDFPDFQENGHPNLGQPWLGHCLAQLACSGGQTMTFLKTMDSFSQHHCVEIRHSQDTVVARHLEELTSGVVGDVQPWNPAFKSLNINFICT